MLENSKFVSILQKINERSRERALKQKDATRALSVRFAADSDCSQIQNIIWHAFKSKMTKFATTLEEYMSTMRPEDFAKDRLLVASRENSSQILGTVGFSVDNTSYLNVSLWNLTQRRGYLKGATAWTVARLMNTKASTNELYVSAIAAAPESRGMGAGTVLLEALEEFAVAQKKQQLRLHVIEDNLEARRLYERVGYKVVQTIHIGPLQYLLGFKRVHEMVKPLEK